MGMPDTIASIVPYLIPADPNPHPWWSHKPYVLVRIETREGVIGWGECNVLDFREHALTTMVKAVADIVIGRPADGIRAVWNDAHERFGQQRPSLEVYSAFAGIELAMWDALGKRLDTPVHVLLGGAVRDTVDVYANIFSPHPQVPQAFAEMASRQVEAGHRAIKLYPYTAETKIEDGVAVLRAVRDAVGPDVGLAVDLWRHASPSRAIDLARAMEPFDLLWLEDPFAPSDAASLRYVRDVIHQPLLTGETLPTRREFAPLFADRAVDIVNPDICLSGLLETHAIAALAAPAFASVSPHNSNSMALGTAAAVHAGLGIVNLGLIEFFPLFEAALDDICEGRPAIVGGSIAKPFAPGLGVSFDEKAIERYRV